MCDIEYPTHLLHKSDRAQVVEAIREFDLDEEGNMSKLIFDLVSSINEETDPIEKSRKLVIYNQLLLNFLKHSNNREVLTFEIEFNEYSPLSNRSQLLRHLNTTEDRFYYNQVLDPNILDLNYKLLYRNLNLMQDNESINSIELLYGRVVLYKKIDSQTGEPVERYNYEYIWIEVNAEEKLLRIIISNNLSNRIDGQSNGTRNKIIKEFIPRIKSKFIFTIDEDLNESHTLFKMYKELTGTIEKEYNDKISNRMKVEINKLTTYAKSDLNISEREDIGLNQRIEKLLERNLIKMDFTNFISKEVNEGRVMTVGFTDAVGGSVRANSGGKGITENGEVIFDLQKSDVYFDIKETIYTEKKLQSITILWNNKYVIPGDSRYENVLVKYSAYNGFYSTHFLKDKVRKEIYDYVLPKFEEFKRR